LQVKDVLPKVEAVLARFGARPHMGKLFLYDHTYLKKMYPQFEEFKKLMKEFDPQGKFQNDFLRRVFHGGSLNAKL
jgi:xylitol oxidase